MGLNANHSFGDCEPTRYARRDREGNIVDDNERAPATKECLAKDHWGIKPETETQDGKTEKKRLRQTYEI